MKAIKRNYSASGGGVDIESMQDLFYGSLEEREALADAIADRKVPTNVSDSLITMANNIKLIPTYEFQEGTKTGSQKQGDSTHTVQFLTPFSKPPKVGVSTTSYGFGLNNIRDITVNGFSFTANMGTTGTRDYAFQWWAIAML